MRGKVCDSHGAKRWYERSRTQDFKILPLCTELVYEFKSFLYELLEGRMLKLSKVVLTLDTNNVDMLHETPPKPRLCLPLSRTMLSVYE